MSVLHNLVEWIGRRTVLDAVADRSESIVRPALRARPVTNALNGTWLGHPLHPLLVVAPIGTWASAGLLDLIGGEEAEPSADALVVAGVVSALPTAAAGYVQWVDTYGEGRRVGIVHAITNIAALALQVASIRDRRAGRRGRGRALSYTALGAVAAGGYLGGHLSYVYGVGVDHTAFTSGPDDWTATGVAPSDVVEGRATATVAGDRQVLLTRHGGRLVALDAVCTHAGGPLPDGELADGCVRCPWHGSVFRLDDGTVVEGPATAPQPRLEVRALADVVEVRAV